MVKQIDSRDIITNLEARMKYRDKYIGFVTVDQKMADPDNEKIIVKYLIDTYDDCFLLPLKTADGQIISHMEGLGVGGTEIGGIVFDE